MITEQNLNGSVNPSLNIAGSGEVINSFKILIPLQMNWQPKEDITTYELAMCLPYFFRNHGVMPNEVDKTLSHFRHFEIIDHNEY